LKVINWNKKVLKIMENGRKTRIRAKEKDGEE
jgi:hypothetical protein